MLIDSFIFLGKSFAPVVAFVCFCSFIVEIFQGRNGVVLFILSIFFGFITYLSYRGEIKERREREKEWRIDKIVKILMFLYTYFCVTNNRDTKINGDISRTVRNVAEEILEAVQEK